MKNVSMNDRYVRYGMATILIILAIVFGIWWLLIPAVIMIITGYRRVCHFYQIFGIGTCKLEDKK